jgi:hypothetical protein
MMMDPRKLQETMTHIVLHAWVDAYTSGRYRPAADLGTFSVQISEQATRLRESAVQLQAALEKMRIANEKLALRMAEHKAFFAKYQTPQPNPKPQQ